jgi:hypothetical protein
MSPSGIEHASPPRTAYVGEKGIFGVLVFFNRHHQIEHCFENTKGIKRNSVKHTSLSLMFDV